MRLIPVATLLAAAGLAGAGEPVEVRVGGVGRDAASGAPVVQLVERSGGGRTLPIWIGPIEADAIARALRGIASPRPLTHDLLARTVTALGAVLDRVEIGALVGETYHATLHLRAGDRTVVPLDARPSDAIALALRLDRPIVVNPALFLSRRAPAADGVERVLGLTVQALTADLAEALDAGTGRGVLVSAVDPAGPAARLRPGDVITGVDGEAVATPADLAAVVARRTPDEVLRLEVRRQGRARSLRVRLPPAPLSRRRGDGAAPHRPHRVAPESPVAGG